MARSTTDFARLLDRSEKKGWKVVVLDVDVDTTTAAGRLVVEVVSAAAAFESRRIGERAKATHAIRKAQGKRAGQPPFCQRSTSAGRRRAGQRVVARVIAKKFNDEGVPDGEQSWALVRIDRRPSCA